MSNRACRGGEHIRRTYEVLAADGQTLAIVPKRADVKRTGNRPVIPELANLSAAGGAKDVVQYWEGVFERFTQNAWLETIFREVV